MAEAADWQKLANALRELHRTLVETARREYERAHLVELSAGELLQRLTSDAEFAWLRGLSELMVDLDLVHDAALPEQGDIEPAVRAAVEHLLSNAQTPAGVFAQRYWPVRARSSADRDGARRRQAGAKRISARAARHQHYAAGKTSARRKGAPSRETKIARLPLSAGYATLRTPAASHVCTGNKPAAPR